MNCDHLKLDVVGERQLVRAITSDLEPDPQLVDGFGHDSAFLDIKLGADDLVMLNTDRSGMNIAYKLGLADGSCVGDFGVSHAVSDIFAAGGKPVAITIALMLPHDMSVGFVKEVMRGADMAARKYGAFIAAGDTKHGNKFAMVVTVLGKCRRQDKLTRSGARPHDLIIATGEFGSMLSGVIAAKHGLRLEEHDRKKLENAIIWQNPPYKLSLAISGYQLAHACMDNSDGIAGTIHALCEASHVGAVLFKNSITIPDVVRKVARSLNVDPFQLCLGSGDWQHVFAVPDNNVDEFLSLAAQSNTPAAVIGEFTSSQSVLIKSEEGVFELPCLENDRFGIGGTAWFDWLEQGAVFQRKKVQTAT